MKWILASGSPRRQQLLCQITEDFSVLPSQIEERRDPSWTAQELPRQLAAQKALDVSSRNPAALVIGADTIVSLDGTVLGKPRDEADAADMLRHGFHPPARGQGRGRPPPRCPPVPAGLQAACTYRLFAGNKW